MGMNNMANYRACTQRTYHNKRDLKVYNSQRGAMDAYFAKKAKRDAKYSGFTFRPGRLAYSANGEVDAFTTLMVFGTLLGLTMAGCGCLGGRSEDDVATGDVIELRGKMLDENHWAGQDQKIGTKDDLYQIHMSSESGDKAVDFHGEKWDCSEVDKKLGPGDSLALKAMKESRGHYDAMEIEEV